MPLHRYRTYEEAERALWNPDPDETYCDQLAELWKFADELSPIDYPRGIFRYRSIEEADKQRCEWELAHARAVQVTPILTVRTGVPSKPSGRRAGTHCTQSTNRQPSIPDGTQ